MKRQCSGQKDIPMDENLYITEGFTVRYVDVRYINVRFTVPTRNKHIFVRPKKSVLIL